MRLKSLLGLATCVAATTGVLAFAAPAQAAQLPCHLAGSGGSASATCYSGSSITWRLAVDCLDTSDIKWPKIAYSVKGKYRTGDGSDAISCDPGLRADGRIELKR